MEERFISLLALERCETYVAHVCALMHNVSEEGSIKEHQKNTENIMHIMRNMSRDISLIKQDIE